MKILQLISSAGFFGAENVLLELSGELKTMGHSVTVGVFQNRRSPNLELYERAIGASLDTRVFECRGRIDLKTVSEIASFVRGNSIDVVHSHGYKSNIYAYISSILIRRPLVSTCHNWISRGGKTGLYSYIDKKVLKKFDAVAAVSEKVREELFKAGIKKKQGLSYL